MATQNSTQIVSAEKIASQYSNAISEWISTGISDKGLKVPAGYDYQNEVTSAMLYIAQNVKDKNKVAALEVCTRDSVMSSLRDMAIQGLSFTRHHVYFIVRGKQLMLMESYFGQVFALKNMDPNLEVGANVLYEGDEYEYCTDEVGSYNYVRNVRSKLENRDKPIIGAYGTIFDKTTGKMIYGCVMTMKEIQASWGHAQTDTVQKEFPQEMAKRTLIKRLIKLYLNTTPGLNQDFVAAFNRTTENEYADDGELQNVTPPETEVEKQKLIRGKSKGQAGLAALLHAQDASEGPEEETTQPEPENAPEQELHASETNLEREPSVRVSEDGEILPNDDEGYDPSEIMLDEDGNPLLIPF